MSKKGVQGGWDPKAFGFPNDELDTVAPLSSKPVRKVNWEGEDMDDDAWKAYDATLVVSDNDRVLADRMFDAARKQRRKGK